LRRGLVSAQSRINTMADAFTDIKTTPGRRQGMRFLLYAARFWAGDHTRAAWLWTIAVIVSLIAQNLAFLAMNFWNRAFFDALEKRDVATLWTTASYLPVLVLCFAASLTGLMIARMMFQARWRADVTQRLLRWWLSDQRYYRLRFTAPEQSSPEFRIAEDVRLAIEPLVEFAIGLATALFSAVTFAAVLWTVAGSARFEIGGVAVVIPAYMAVSAVIYAIIVSTAAFLTSRPLVGRVADKNEAEGNFRADMTRLRENAESIALIRGDSDERRSLLDSYGRVFVGWLGVIRQNGILGIVLNTNSAVFALIPLLLITPKYLSGEVTLGGVMQVTAAFSAVQASLIWFVDNAVKLAEWYASARRVVEFTDALEAIDVNAGADQTSIDVRHVAEPAITVTRLEVSDHAGRLVIGETSLMIQAGEKVMLTGESGAGKSILVRAMAGLWPWGSGQIAFPQDARVVFVPQRPYVPLGTLREIMVYPGDVEVSDEDIVAAMRRCGLSYLTSKLDVADRWSETLSGGERQRIAFVRLLLQKPSIIIMDEATSALDEDSQFSLLSLLHQDLASATVISVAHRAGVEEFHARRIHIEKRPAGAHITQTALVVSLWRLIAAQWASGRNAPSQPS
jgi:putative ATP-binding cassette transporter